MPPPKKNSLMRIVVPFTLATVGIGIAVAVAVNTTRQGGGGSSTTAPSGTATRQTDAAGPTAPTPPDTTATPAQPTTPVAPAQTVAQDGTETPLPVAQQPAQQAAQPGVDPAQVQAVLTGLKPQVFELPDASPASVGGLDPQGDLKLHLEFDLRGAGVSSLRLADGFTTMQAELAAAAGDPVPLEEHVQLQTTLSQGNAFLTPLAASSININGTTVWLDDHPTGSVWRERAPGVFEAIILNAQDDPVARVERRYVIIPGSHSLILEQHVDNLSPVPFTALLATLGLADMPEDLLGYGGDKRRVRFGYLANPAVDPARTAVTAAAYLIPRTGTFGTKNKATGEYAPVAPIWPTAKGQESQHELVWVGVTNRYFGVVLHKVVRDPPSDPKSPTLDRVFRQIERIERVLINRPVPQGGLLGTSMANDPLMALSLVSKPLEVPAGARISQNISMYAGPLLREAIEREPAGQALGLAEIIVYNFGGMCAACTFAWLTGPLLGLMRFLHTITFDWSLSIILLVVVVRTILHPVTRWSQIRMQRFGKQMQNMAPKQKKVQERYADDPQKMREEMAKLWREEGVSPAGFLGCLPMFLQSPVWIALYATLYFAYELRHQPAFFGLFQSLTNNSWRFMADLSEPDRAIYFGQSVITIPLMGAISSFNILPLLLGAVFYVHQKYLTPPSSTALTPEQEQQQKMMRWISVIMFPVFMYNAPCGLSLYFITNSTLAIIETRWIRAHIDQNNLLDAENLKRKPKAPPKPGSLTHRLQTLVQEQQAKREQMDKRSPKREPRPTKPEPTQRNYKKKR